MNNKVKRVLVAVAAVGAFTGAAAVTVAAMPQEQLPAVQPDGSDMIGQDGSGASGVGGAGPSGDGA